MNELGNAKPYGKHLILDGWEADPGLLNDAAFLTDALRRAVSAGKGTIIEVCVHEFSPKGVTATATLMESHIALHTWPEDSYFAADLFFCVSGDPHAAAEALVDAIAPQKFTLREIERGIRVSDHPVQQPAPQTPTGARHA